MLLEGLATLCAGFFAGAATYITFVEHPARLECGTELAAKEFGPSYRRATVMQASLAAVGLIAALIAWAQGRGVVVLVGGLLLGLVIPFTLIVILPTNQRLLDPSLDRQSGEAARSWCAGVGSTQCAACSVPSRSESWSPVWRCGVRASPQSCLTMEAIS